MGRGRGNGEEWRRLGGWVIRGRGGDEEEWRREGGVAMKRSGGGGEE